MQGQISGSSSLWKMKFISLTGLAIALASNATAAETARPNVLLICVDDLKPNIGTYGDPMAKTPNIDALAKRAVVFEKAYCNQAVCSPSRNALLTSLRPQTLGIYDLPTNFRKGKPDAVTLPELFRMAGYRTEGMGKIFHPGHGNHEDAQSWSVPYFRPKADTYALAENKAAGGQGNAGDDPGSRGAASEKADVPDNFYADGKVADEAIRRLEAAKADSAKPFFLAVGFIRPHLPFNAPAKYWDMHDRAAFRPEPLKELPAGSPAFAGSNSGELRRYKNVPEQGPVSEEMARDLVHGYYAATSYTDAQIGRVLATIDRTGLAENTIVVLWGDHGWHLGDHGLWCKHTNYEQAARVPLIVAAPGIAAGRSSALIETVDVYPTIAELAGLSVPKGLDGVSQAIGLKFPGTRARDSVIHVYPRAGNILGRAIRTDRYRMVEWKRFGAGDESAEYELFDYVSDPVESRNLADAEPAVLRFMKSLLASHPEPRPQVGKPLPEPTKDVVPPKQAAKDTPKKKTDRAALFARRDTDGDGQLSRAEFLANQPDPDMAPARFDRFDSDRNGVLSRAEFIGMGKPATP